MADKEQMLTQKQMNKDMVCLLEGGKGTHTAFYKKSWVAPGEYASVCALQVAADPG